MMDLILKLLIVRISCNLFSKGYADLAKLPQYPHAYVVEYTDKFTMTCNYDSFKMNNLSPNLRMYYLSMVRKCYNRGWESMIQYLPGHTMTKDYDQSRKWNVTTTGGGRLFQTGDFSIVVQVNDARCEDAGLYRCLFQNDPWKDLIVSVPILFKRIVGSHLVTKMEDRIYVYPDSEGSMDTTFISTHGQYTLDCRFTGQDGLTVSWRYPNKENEDTVHRPLPFYKHLEDNDGCQEFKYMSLKVVPGSATGTHYCMAMKGNKVEGVSSMTLVGGDAFKATNAGEMIVNKSIVLMVQLSVLIIIFASVIII